MTGSYRWFTLLGSLRFRPRFLDRRGHVLFERLEVLHEHARELARLFVVGTGVRPGAARVEHGVRHAGTGRRHVEVEDRVLLILHVIVLPGQRRGDHPAGARDFVSDDGGLLYVDSTIGTSQTGR